MPDNKGRGRRHAALPFDMDQGTATQAVAALSNKLHRPDRAHEQENEDPMIGKTRLATHSAVMFMAMAAFALPLAAQTAAKAKQERSGKQVVDAVCAACHATGKDGAPKIGDKKAWAPRAAQGLTSLTKHAIEGIRKMPPHGGTTSVDDLEISRAIAYMVNQSGGNWTEPTDKTAKPAARTGEQVVNAQCIKCHGTGVSGAPKIGDRAAWTPRISRGLDAVVASAIHGHGAMPARGGMPDATDAEIRSAVIYMFNKGTVPVK
jgi:cytochrome c5